MLRQASPGLAVTLAYAIQPAGRTAGEESASLRGARRRPRASSRAGRSRRLRPARYYLTRGRARASTAPSPTLGGGKPRAAHRASTAGGGSTRTRARSEDADARATPLEVVP